MRCILVELHHYVHMMREQFNVQKLIKFYKQYFNKIEVIYRYLTNFLPPHKDKMK